jgi:hypothetical protein
MENPSREEIIASIHARMKEIKSLEEAISIHYTKIKALKERAIDVKALINIDLILLKEFYKDKK